LTSITVDPVVSERELRMSIYRGNLVLFSRLSSAWELVQFTRSELEALFAPHDPEYAHQYLSPDEAAALLGKWKPRFMRLERTRSLLAAIIEEVGLPPRDTYVDFLKPRTAFPKGHLTTGIAFAFPWHRDTWYAAPPQQLNWWLPVFDVNERNAMMFDLSSFSQRVSNTSSGFDYYKLNEARRDTARQVGTEVQARPAAEGHQPQDPLVVIGRPGSALLFSGAHLHASIPNESGRSRFSVDFRTVDRRDVLARTGAPLMDVECSGTALRDFVRSDTLESFDEGLVQSLYGVPPRGAALVFNDSSDGLAR
jgi:hypothetical protein